MASESGSGTLDESIASKSPLGIQRSTRYEPIVETDDDEDEIDSTIRRSRPRPISTKSMTYGSIRTAQDATPTQESSRTGIQSPEIPSRQAVSPEPTGKSKKPALSRRSSSRYHAPHKGQEFSVDDGPAEYESDYAHRLSTGRTTAGASPALRKQPSTLRRRQTIATILPRVESQDEEEDRDSGKPSKSTGTTTGLDASREEGEVSETMIRPEDHGEDDGDDDEDDEDDDVSDAESFTLKDRQTAINQTHPFGIRIWKPALYKKNRSVEKNADGDIHSSPGGRVRSWLWLFNGLWTILFGWWLAAAAALGALVCFVLAFAPGAADYGRVLWGLAGYMIFPFGKFVKLDQDEDYAEEDEGEGRSITEYEQWQSGDLEDGRLFFGPLASRSLVGRRRASMDSAGETESLLGHSRTIGLADFTGSRTKRRFFGRGQWTFGRLVFFVFFYFLIAPLMLLTSGICFFLVFWIPMGKVNLMLFYHLRRHPLALSFHSDAAYSRDPADARSSSILLCTYRAVGLKYWKYTIDGTNIFLINLIVVVLFAIFDYWVLKVALGLQSWVTHPGFVFALALFSIIPLAYFIGQAVASISAQSSMGLGAAINAFFSTVVEVFLYCVALKQGKGKLVEGSVIGSIFAGILFLPGLSMCFGAIHRKTQRFNVKSAGVTSTMLLFAVIAAFGPTLFYQIYGSHELNCQACITNDATTNSTCRRCYFAQVPTVNDRFFIEAVRPYCWFAAVMLFLSYVIGLWFTLRTHAATIWNDVDEKKVPISGGMNGSIIHTGNPPQPSKSASLSASGGKGQINDSQLCKRILGQSLKQVGLAPTEEEESGERNGTRNQDGTRADHPTPYLVPPKSSGDDGVGETTSLIDGLSEAQNAHLVRQVAEAAAIAATVAARDATMSRKRQPSLTRRPTSKAPTIRGEVVDEMTAEGFVSGEHAGGGHDAPNWSRTKSAVILLGATILYAIIAEILVSTVDVVLDSVDIDEKFLGITLFALVPNTTEFLNAISFAMNGNIALSMEIGSAYALQVCLLQIPALVLFSAVSSSFIDPSDVADYTFNLIFPQWDMVTVILCVFLLSYVYGEGKSNYFKGSILVLTYLVIVLGFYLSGYSNSMNASGVDRFEVLPSQGMSFKTIGRGTSGRAY